MVASAPLLTVAAPSSQHFALMRRAMQFRCMAVIDISFELHQQHHSHCHDIYPMGLLGTGGKADSTSVGLPSEGRPQYTPELKKMIGFGMGVTGLTMADYLDPSADH
jgi:PST family polysaccharide transporter